MSLMTGYCWAKHSGKSIIAPGKKLFNVDDESCERDGGGGTFPEGVTQCF